MKFQSDAYRDSYDNFPKVTCLGCNSRVCKNPNFLRSYIRKYSETSCEVWAWASPKLRLKWVLILESEPSQKNNYRENSTLTCLRWNSGVSKNPSLLRSYLRKYSDTRSEIWTWGSVIFHLKWFVFLTSEISQKKSYSENATMTYLE